MVLLNAAYQDGHDRARDTARVALSRFARGARARAPGSSCRLRAVPARRAVWLDRDRIYASACALVAAFYAAGYALSAVRSDPWLKRIERWNFYGALLVLAVLLALFTPIADPYRISVASQVARLESGAVTPEQFDFANLRWEGGRFGQAALERLKATTDGPRPDYVRDVASRALVATNRFGRLPNPEIIGTNVTAHPAGATLPPSFLAQDWSASGTPIVTSRPRGVFRDSEPRCAMPGCSISTATA